MTDDERHLYLTFPDGSIFRFWAWWGGDPQDWIPAGHIMIEAADGELIMEDDVDDYNESLAKEDEEQGEN
jgi:hypothetical protein